MQTVSLHVLALVAVAGGAIDTNGDPLALSNLAGGLVSGSGVEFVPDEDSADNNVAIQTSDEVGAVSVVTFTADGPDNRKFEAEAEITLVAKEIVVEPMSLTFTEVVA